MHKNNGRAIDANFPAVNQIATGLCPTGAMFGLLTRNARAARAGCSTLRHSPKLPPMQGERRASYERYRTPAVPVDVPRFLSQHHPLRVEGSKRCSHRWRLPTCRCAALDYFFGCRRHCSMN